MNNPSDPLTSQLVRPISVVNPERKRFLKLDDLTSMPKPMWAIEGMFEVNSLIMIAGPPASYKSFLCLDWLLCMASGRAWAGRTTAKMKVVYVLGEGKSSLLKRAQAWLHYNQASQEDIDNINENFRVTFEVPQMAVKPSVDNMLAQLNDEGYQPNIIAIDTFARSFVGLDENSQKDTGLWVESAERLRSLGYTVIFLHHTKKNIDFGLQYRGSTAIMGAMDTAMLMSADKSKSQATLTVVKQKDHDEGDPLRFSRIVVKPDPRDEGSVVLVPSFMPAMDERFTEQGQKVEEILPLLLSDQSFQSDRERARVLAQKTGLSESAAQARVSRARKM